MRRDERRRAIQLDELTDQPGERVDRVGLERLARGSSGGSTVTSRSASIVLPTPGGPDSSRWWPPVAAISSASRASGWPTTSARSGPDRGRARPTAAAPDAGGSGVAVLGARAYQSTTSRRRAGAVHGHAVDELGLADVLERHHDVP